jgi:hypothetical protein
VYRKWSAESEEPLKRLLRQSKRRGVRCPE